MSNYDNPRPSAATPYEDPCAIKDMAVTLGKLMDESGTIATYTGKQLDTVTALANRFGWIDAGTFAAGVTISYKNELVKDGSGDFWQWQGAFPKVVTAGSAPSTPTWIKIIVTDHSNLQGLQSGRGHAGIHPRVTTVAEIAAGVFSDGDSVIISDRNGALAKIQTGGVANGFGVLSAGASKTALINNLDTVLLSHYGAGGGADSSQAVNAAFSAAKVAGLMVVGDVNFSLSSRVDTLGVEFDFSKIKVTVLQSADSTITANQGSIILISEPDQISLTGFNLGAFIKGQSYTSALASYGICSVHIISTEKAYDRNNGGVVAVNKQDILYCSNGYHRATPAIYTITSNVSATVKPIRETINCKLPTFIILGKATVGTVQSLVRVERNNVETTGGYVDSNTPSAAAGEQLIRAVIEHYGIVMPTVTKANSVTSALSFCYQVVGNAVFKTVMRDCSDVTGWALQDGNFIRDTIIEDCTGTRIGSHAMAYNFTATNFTSTRSGIDVMGEGSLRIRNLTHTFGLDTIDSPVSTRTDYGQCWDGDIDIDGVSMIVSNDHAPTTISLFKLNFANTLGVDYTSDCIVGRNISIQNVTIVSKKSVQINYSPISYNTNYSQQIRLPSCIEIGRHSITGDVRATYGGFLAHTNTNVLQTTTVINMRKIQNPSGLSELFQLVTNAVKPTVRNKVVRNYEDVEYGLSVTCNLPSGWSINFKNSNVALFDSKSGETDAGEYILSNNKITGSTVQGNEGSRIKLFHNEYTHTGTINGGAGVVWCVGNVVPPSATFAGGGPSTAADYFSFKSTVYK